MRKVELENKLKQLKSDYYEAVDSYGVRSTQAKEIKKQAEPLRLELGKLGLVILF